MPDHKLGLDEKVNHDQQVRANVRENQKALTQDHDQEVNPDRNQKYYHNGEDPTDQLALKEIDLHQFAFDVVKKGPLKRKLHKSSKRQKGKSHRRC